MSPNIRKWISMTAFLPVAAIAPAAFFTPMLLAGDLSSYRDFQLGMGLNAVEKQADMKTSEAKMIHQRPAVIQDLEWRPRRFPGPAPESDPVKDILFSFYNSRLFRIIVNYDRYKTEGMTAEDMIDAISATYGLAARPAVEILFPSASSEKVKVLARWEDAKYSLNLVRSPYQPSFALFAISKQLDTLAQAAVIEATRLDEQEAPQREADLQKKQGEDNRVQQEKARMANKPGFRP
jgi:hypothetical protein